jgi:thiol-disulfide isomerase/thioredoxin
MRFWLTIGAALTLGLLTCPAWAQAPEADQAGMEVGDIIPAFEAEGLDGQLKQISFEGKKTVLMFFLSSCPTCHKMIPEWNRAFSRKDEQLQVVAVMLDREPPGFFMAMPIEFPVVRAPTRTFGRELGVQRVPLTARVGPDAKVSEIGRGLLDPIRVGEIFRP